MKTAGNRIGGHISFRCNVNRAGAISSSPKKLPCQLVSFVLILLAATFCVICLAAKSLSQDAQDQLFQQAVQAYNRNDLALAEKSFSAVQGPHAEEAKQYVSRIKAYREAMTLGESALNRSADELDIRNLEFAIKQFQQALSIKSDGPWDPRGKIEKAKALEAPLQKQNAASNEDWSKEFCQKAQDAAHAHHYKQAALYSCPLADDSPGYLCNGDEAIHLCEQMRELAELKPDLPDISKPSQAEVPARRDTKSPLAAATAAYDSNDFVHAAQLFQNVTGSDQGKAKQFMQQIEKYQFFMKQAEQFLRRSKYDQARANYQEAARIKADGPGDPSTQAILMDLEQGISAFYSGNYDDADTYLAAYAQEATQRQDLAHFYLGASKISRFFLEGEQDHSLREDAIAEFRIAKQQGFNASSQDISPKILKTYQQENF
jgi:outer membrane protein assembly factor BamD (BamD/ComL family)